MGLGPAPFTTLFFIKSMGRTVITAKCVVEVK